MRIQILKIESRLALHVTLYYFFVLFLVIGIASALAFIVTAKLWAVVTMLLILAGGWFLLYKVMEGLTARKNPATIPQPTPSWQPGLK